MSLFYDLTPMLMKTAFFWDMIPANWYTAVRNYGIYQSTDCHTPDIDVLHRNNTL
jgi:hypothetical protein